MNDVVFWPDVSHYQVPVDDRFARPFLMYKISEGATYVDPHWQANGGWCHTNAGPGRKMLGYGGYHVWTPGNEQAQADLFFRHAYLSPYFVAMIDVESWRDPATGKPRYSGDHSASITALVNLFVAKLGQQRVKVYANSGDLAELYPTRPPRLGLVKAKYGSFAPAEPWSGWQYTDGSTNNPRPTSYPRASAPFGNCDHNAYLGTLAEFAVEWGISTSTPTPTHPTPTGTAPVRVPPPQKGDAMAHRILYVDPKSPRPANEDWPGEFLQGDSSVTIHHIADQASANSYRTAGAKQFTITWKEYAQYRAEGLVGNPVKA